MGIRLLMCLIFFYTLLACQKNPYTKFSSQDSDAAIFEEALKAYNQSQFFQALNYFGQLSPGYMQQRHVRFYYAKSLAGRCGFQFLSFIDALQQANFGGSNSPMKVIMSLWGNTSVLPSFCTQSEAQMKWIQTQFGTLTTEEKLFFALLSLSKMGMYMRIKHDVAENNGLGDGNVDSGVDSCTPGANTGQFTDAEITEIITGFALLNTHLAALGSIASNAAAISNALSTICSLPGVSFCNLTEASQVTASDINAMRNILVFDATGLDGNSSCVPLSPTHPIPPSCCP